MEQEKSAPRRKTTRARKPAKKTVKRTGSGIGHFLGRLNAVVTGIRIGTFNVLFVLVVIFVIFAAVGGSLDKKPGVSVSDDSLLIVKPSGWITEQSRQSDELYELLQANNHDNSDMLSLLELLAGAADDERIKAVLLDLNALHGISTTQAFELGALIDDIRESGKRVVARADYFGQNGYLLASFADEIWMDPNGAVMVHGLDFSPMYLKGALEKLKLTVNIFRAGTYKDAVEPYMSQSMSELSKAHNQSFINMRWARMSDQIQRGRSISQVQFAAFSERLHEQMQNSGESMSQAALSSQMVDQLLTRNQQRQLLAEMMGEEEYDDIDSIRHGSYLKALRSESDGRGKLGLIVAEGSIYTGSGDGDNIGSSDMVKLIERAADMDIKGLLLRINSPGGSAFASEKIRQALLNLREQKGIPIVVFMSSLAASGGYWIAADADQIWAMNNTITGSIGAFSMFPTLENSLAHLGITADGVRTSPLAGGPDMRRRISDEWKAVLQADLDVLYGDFVNLVAEGRDLPVGDMDAIAEGRIWNGAEAEGLGLVDSVGTMADAARALADMAGVESSRLRPVRQRKSTAELLIKILEDSASARLNPMPEGPVRQALELVEDDLSVILQNNDPRGQYLLCTPCMSSTRGI